MDNSECGASASGRRTYGDAPSGAKNVLQGSGWVHPTGGAPRTVDIVALGYSMRSYMHRQLTKGLDVECRPDEVWTVNRGIRLIRADMAFVLDELPDEIENDPAYGIALQTAIIPIISTRCDPSVPMSTLYPAADILDCLRSEWFAGLMDPYWHNSMPMVLAYALCLGVEEVTLWGCDYQSEQGLSLEDDRANLEYWVGICRACGMRVGVPDGSTLLNNRKTGGRLEVYGLRDQRRAREYLGIIT